MGGRLADLQARQVEVGRIRLGTTETKTSRAGKPYQSPVKLERFRLTSRSQQLIEEVAARYGGDPEPWNPQSGGAQQFEVIIERTSLPIIVPPDPLSQFYEVWASGKVQRRCDGLRELLSDQPCLCAAANPDPARRQCKPYTRLSVMLAEMNGIGVWRLETHGYNAAVELPAVADLLSRAGGNIKARLEMEERQSVVEVNGKETISRYMVPVIHVEATPAAIVGSFQPHEAIEAPTASAPALEQAPPTPTPVGPAEPVPTRAEIEQEATEAAHAWATEMKARIIAAATRDEMVAIRQLIVDAIDAPQLADLIGPLKEVWSIHARALATTQLPQAPPPQATPSATAPPAAAAPLDRTEVWLAIQKWAGYQKLTTSQIAVRFKAWGTDPAIGAGEDYRLATAEQLQRFLGWLEASANGPG